MAINNISAGVLSSLALDSAGKIWSWGDGSSGQLGINSVDIKITPVSILGVNKTFCTIEAGNSSNHAIDKYGRVWGWGINSSGKLGDNSITNRSTPVSVLGVRKTFCKIATGDTHTLAIDVYGRVWSWGINTNGQLGNNTIISTRTPVSVKGTYKTFCHISAGQNHSIAVDKYGRVWSWGLNTSGQLGKVIFALTPTMISHI